MIDEGKRINYLLDYLNILSQLQMHGKYFGTINRVLDAIDYELGLSHTSYPRITYKPGIDTIVCNQGSISNVTIDPDKIAFKGTKVDLKDPEKMELKTGTMSTDELDD